MLISTNVYQIIHIVLDVVLLVLLVYSLKNRDEKAKNLIPHDIIEEMEKTIEHTREVTRQFETTLSERKVIIEKLVAQLDNRVRKAEKTLEKFERIPSNRSNSLDNVSSSENSIRKILENIDKGLSIDEICSKYNKPKGEVELIVKLYSQSKPHLTREVNTS